ncbi:hypothetical protein PbJCM13498_32130 [Prolixibacter bellariivorans]|uniref:Uncharacterized protein n=1 Tax=Prolixibacter bellariivorans TaxID=314319 RepID=A0A5M4B2F7_9BACT|nr:hypothetical protein [Prolixibacter bellariivorans]GET34350.1 hypothetical protein PbJCM13498_32130 [Prolixibacter bellariivorans]
MKTLFIQIFIATFLFTNHTFQQGKQKDDLSTLRIVNIRDTLIIAFQGTDCGEWGGHRETIYLQRNKERKITARYLKDTVPCDIVEKHGIGVLDDAKREVIVDTSKVLNTEEERQISNFIKRVSELYIEGGNWYWNFGDYYTIKNTNGTFLLHYWNSGNNRETGYHNMIKKIFQITHKK